MAAVPRKNDINRTEEEYPRLGRFEWDFSSCPDWELAECWYYEFKRESPLVRQIIVDWRMVCDPPTFDGLLTLAQIMLMPPRTRAFVRFLSGMAQLSVSEHSRRRA